jgi:pyruvate dehydrogenase E2 component (dihydrolipoamide acetyltransferase)
MPVPLRMPDLGTVEGEVTLVRWLKAEGEPIALGEPLFEVETDKGVSEVEAAMAGVLEKRVAAEGARVASGDTIAFVRRHGENAGGAAGPAVQTPEETGSAPRQPVGSAEKSPPPAARRIAPVIRALAAKWGVDIDSMSGSGPGGTVTRDDVLTRRDGGKPPAHSARVVVSARTPPSHRILSRSQSIVARKVSQSHREKPVYRMHALVDMSRIIEARRKDGSSPGAAGDPPRFDAFFVKAAAVSIAQSPVFRSFLREDEVEEHGEIDIAVALGIGDEIYAPAVRHADRRSVPEISREIGSLAEKAASHSLSAGDSDDSCFLLSNLGMFPIESFEAIIYPEHAAALAVGAVTRLPIADGESVRIAPMVRLTLSADHRLINGAAAARFLERVKQVLENGESA